MMDWLMGSIVICVVRLLLRDVKDVRLYGIVHKTVKRVIGKNIKLIVKRNRKKNRNRIPLLSKYKNQNHSKTNKKNNNSSNSSNNSSKKRRKRRRR